MSVLTRHFLEGLLLTILAYVLAGAADFAKANPVPGWDQGLIAVLVGTLLASAAYVRAASASQPTTAASWRHFVEGLIVTLGATALAGGAGYLKGNPLAGYDPALSAMLVGVLLAGSKWLRDQLTTPLAAS